MPERDELFHAVLSDSTDDALREALRDELVAAGSWDWATALRYLLAYPEADGPRLLAADWLAENARPDHAEFVRVQCRLGRLLDVLGGGVSSRDDVARLVASERRLAVGLGDVLTGELIPREWASWWSGGGEFLRVSAGEVALDFVRGFVGGVEMGTLTFLRHAAALFRGHPVAEVRLLDKAPVEVAGGWGWGDTCLDPDDPACRVGSLPPPLYACLVRTAGRGRRHGPLPSPAGLTFPTPGAALAALSAACVAHGRALAGQAPHTRPPTPGGLS